MITKIAGVSIIIILASAGFVVTEEPPRTVNVNIVEDQDGVWRIRDNNGSGQGSMKVRSADQIFWSTKKSAVVFQFPKNVDQYFEYDQGMFADGYSQRMERNKKLRLTIKEDAPADTLKYQVYVEDADAYVVGNSPPVLIINFQ